MVTVLDFKPFIVEDQCVMWAVNVWKKQSASSFVKRAFLNWKKWHLLVKRILIMAALFMDNNFTVWNSQQTGWVFFDGHVEINTEAEEDKSKFKLRMPRQQIQSGFVIYFEVKVFMDMSVSFLFHLQKFLLSSSPCFFPFHYNFFLVASSKNSSPLCATLPSSTR